MVRLVPPSSCLRTRASKNGVESLLSISINENTLIQIQGRARYVRYNGLMGQRIHSFSHGRNAECANAVPL